MEGASTFNVNLDEIAARTEGRKAPIEWTWMVHDNLENGTFTAVVRYAAIDGSTGFIRGEKSFNYSREELDSIKLNSLDDLKVGALFYKCTYVSLLERKSIDIDRAIMTKLKKDYSSFSGISEKSLRPAMLSLERDFYESEKYDKMLRMSGLLLAKAKQIKDGDSLSWLKRGEAIMESYVNAT
ncbi:hypothetical protein IKF28_01260 [Candidatus Saccharibacteria bacterium]|nr:hypothetical protein [Candidatus Saccharibacteria bacterium]